MISLLAALDYSVFPPINAALNGLCTIFLISGFILIKWGRRRAHRYAMMMALLISLVFLGSYLTYHHGAGSVPFPKEYPLARKIYLAILVPHIILAALNVPFILVLVVAALRGNFVRHKRLARYVFPSWLFVSISGVLIYLMLYVWFLPSGEASEVSARTTASHASTDSVPMAAPAKPGTLVFSPMRQTLKTDPGERNLEVLFSVENPSGSPIRIESLESGCECLEVSIDRNPVPAGEGATIKGVFDIGKLRGAVDRQIAVLVEGHSRPVFLTTRIEIEPIYEIDAEMTSWRRGSEPVTKTVDIQVKRKAPVRVLSAESKRPEVSCELVEVEAGRHYQLRLTPTSTKETLLGIVRLETDCELENYATALVYFSIQ